MIMHNGRLFALVESDLPFEMNIDKYGLMETKGYFDFDNQWDHSFSAHPKIDSENGDLVFFGYKLEGPPYVKVGVANKEGKLLRSYPVTIEKPVMMHDFSITGEHRPLCILISQENYIIILDLPLVFEPEVMVRNYTMPIYLDKSRPSRFGILRRDATDESDIKWFTAPACGIFHVLNSWEEGDEVVLYASRYG